MKVSKLLRSTYNKARTLGINLNHIRQFHRNLYLQLPLFPITIQMLFFCRSSFPFLYPFFANFCSFTLYFLYNSINGLILVWNFRSQYSVPFHRNIKLSVLQLGGSSALTTQLRQHTAVVNKVNKNKTKLQKDHGHQ